MVEQYNACVRPAAVSDRHDLGPNERLGLRMILAYECSVRELRDRTGAPAMSSADERFRAARDAERTLEVYRRVLGTAQNGQTNTA
jgi:hypothetical protein